MKRSHAPALFILALACAALAPARVAAADAPAAPRAAADRARAAQLAADVREFARDGGLSRAKREKRIATAVRTAVVAATAYRQDPVDALGAVTELAAAAAQAAPAYAEVIAKAAALAPGLARVEGSAATIRSAVAASASGKGPRAPRRVETAEADRPARPRAPRRPAPASAEVAAEPAPAPRERVAEADRAEPDRAEAPEFAANRRRGRSPVSETGVRIALTLDTTARRDDNVFNAPANKVTDTIVSATPGVNVAWGEKARTHGSVGYAESFEHYLDGTAPNVSLGTGSFDYTYDGAAVGATATANYQQLNQTNSDLQSQGIGTLLRTDVSSAGLTTSFNPGTKLGGRLGVNYSATNYKSDGLIGNTQVGVPADLVLNLTPKTSLSVGYVYGTQRPDGGGPASKDHYFNLGAQGEFTPKLSGTLNVGFQTRRVGANPAEHLLAFNGNLAYELTPRTGLTLGLTREFNASALGASTKNTSFRLGLNSELTPQFKLGALATYADNQYGAGVFRADQVSPQERTDRLWQGSLTATYLFTEWFSTTASYQLRHNSSTIPTVDFAGNVLSLTLGLKY